MHRKSAVDIFLRLERAHDVRKVPIGESAFLERAALRLGRSCEVLAGFLLLVAGHPAAEATVPTAALDKKPLDAIAAWI